MIYTRKEKSFKFERKNIIIKKTKEKKWLTFPLLVSGNPGVGQIISGVAKGPIVVRTAMRSSLINSSLSSKPAVRVV